MIRVPFYCYRQHEPGKQKVEPTVMKLYLTLSQLYFGELLHVTFDRPVVCLHADECIIQRKDCSSAGVSTVTRSLNPSILIRNQELDDTCIDREKGWKSNCRACPNGSTETQRTYTTIYVEAGMQDNDSVTFEGGGMQKLGYKPGDVVFRIVQIPDET